MRKEKCHFAIDDYEYSVIIDSLINLRNKLIADGRYADADEEQVEIRVWGQRHLRYIKRHHIVKLMAERKGVTEQLKTDNQMEWHGFCQGLFPWLRCTKASLV